MLIAEERTELKGHEIILRNAVPEDAQMLLDFIRTACKETRFLLMEADEVNLTLEQEIDFIERHNRSESNLLILAFVDGIYAGNCSMNSMKGSRREAHRAEVGIALYQKYTGQGLGGILLKRLLKAAKEYGYEQAELTVVDGNERAMKLYKRLGFVECGRTPNANKYDDGTYADDIRMIKKL